MGMHVREGVGFAVLVDSTKDMAFGPVFKGEWEVEDFLDWTGFSDRDLRQHPPGDIQRWYGMYQAETEAGTWPRETEEVSA